VKIYDVSSKDFSRRFSEIEAERPQQVADGMRLAAAAGALVIAKVAPVGATSMLKLSAHAEFPGSKGAMIVVDAPYAALVEVGSRPHWAPIGPLLYWVQRKLGVTNPKTAYAMARAIQIKIARQGTKPQWFMRKRLGLLKQILKDEVEAQLRGVDT
jgi:hypothetical protein